MAEATLKVKTHIGRDLLQSAQLFHTDKKVVWEYVANGLQYRQDGVTPIVSVQIRSAAKQILIRDNGRGMDRHDLGNFFVMHGENQDRRAGRPGRGRFGTGKSAALGIAGCLRVSSVKDGKRNTVELTLKAVERAGPSEIPLKHIELDVPTSDPNGTVITISEVKLRRFDVPGIIQYIEMQIARMPNCGKVVVDDHECEVTEPAVQEEFSITPPAECAQLIGEGPLRLKVSKSPLPSDCRGVAIYANGVWLTTTLAGAENQQMSEWIFGEIDVPPLDDDDVPIPAFDMSRSLQLNTNNEIVAALIPFLGREIDQLRRRLVQAERSRRQQEETRRLANEAQRIADLINTDFQEFNQRLARVRAQSGTGRDLGPALLLGGMDDSSLIVGDEQAGRLELPTNTHVEENESEGGEDSETDSEGTPTQRATELTPDDDGRRRGDPAGGNGRKPRSQGGFEVKFRELGSEKHRAEYIPRTIYINLEHPQIAAALGSSGTNDPNFRRLAYEVAFSEYSIALAQEKNALGEYGDDPSDAIWEIRNTLNRMARRAAELYKP